MEQLGHDQVRDLVVHGRAEEDDPLVEEAGVDVERALPTGGLLDDHRYEWAHGPRFVSLRELESFNGPEGPGSDGLCRSLGGSLATRTPRPTRTRGSAPRVRTPVSRAGRRRAARPRCRA